MKFVLIIVLSLSEYRGNNSSVVSAEFSSREACEAARTHITTSLKSRSWVSYSIDSQGCYKVE